MHVVCFDMGGVLIEINHHWKGALLDAGVEAEVAARFDVPIADLEPFNAFQRGEISREAYLEALNRHFGGGLKDRCLAIHNAILRQTYPGIPELLADLTRLGVPTGCLSNTNAEHWHTVFHEPRLAILRSITYPLASHLVGADKPQPKMYQAFEEACGAPPEAIVYFDDSPDNVKAASNRGWVAFHVDPQGDPASQMRTRLREIRYLSDMRVGR